MTKKKKKKVPPAAIDINGPSSKTPIIPFKPKTDKVPITGVDRGQVVSKAPRYEGAPIYKAQMTWCANIGDVNGEWRWSKKITEPRQWTPEEWDNEIYQNLNCLEGDTWRDIEDQYTGTGKKRRQKNHSQDIDTLNKIAQNRWIELNLEEFSTAYRFRFGGTKRAWGLRLGAHFYLIWYERHHKVYPVG